MGRLLALLIERMVSAAGGEDRGEHGELGSGLPWQCQRIPGGPRYSHPGDAVGAFQATCAP